MKFSPAFIFILFIAIGQLSYAQTQPFYSDIQHFKKQDSLQPPPKNAILFVGSSSFTKWTDVQSYFPSYPILNRGFGGSRLTDVIYYANDIIFPYHPKQIVIYCGENDFASSDTVTAAIVFMRFKNFIPAYSCKKCLQCLWLLSLLNPAPAAENTAAKWFRQIV